MTRGGTNPCVDQLSFDRVLLYWPMTMTRTVEELTLESRSFSARLAVRLKCLLANGLTVSAKYCQALPFCYPNLIKMRHIVNLIGIRKAIHLMNTLIKIINMHRTTGQFPPSHQSSGSVVPQLYSPGSVANFQISHPVVIKKR